MAAEARPGGARTRASAPLWRACTLFSPDRTLARHCEDNSALELYHNGYPHLRTTNTPIYWLRLVFFTGCCAFVGKMDEQSQMERGRRSCREYQFSMIRQAVRQNADPRVKTLPTRGIARRRRGIGLTDCRWAFVLSRAGKYEIA